MINDCFCKYSGGPSILKNRTNSESIVNSNGINYYNIKNHQGNSLLHVVTLDELPEMGRYIIEKGGNINGKNKDGDTPLHLAVRNKKKLMIDVLMNNGAKIDIENAKRETVYELATNDLRKKYNMTKTIIATQNKKKKK
jgi:ankyrin repeat protein